MKIIIEVENRDDFNADNLVYWLNEQLRKENNISGTTLYARLIGVEEEDDESD